MKTGWWSFDLPGYRDGYGTYTLYSYESLPPLPERPDDAFTWLRSQSIQSSALGDYRDQGPPDLSKLAALLAQLDTPIPPSFLTFMHTLELQWRVSSCTACFLEIADRVVRTNGEHRGYLIHFLSDQQWCLHWYLFVEDTGRHFIVCTDAPYGFDLGDAVEALDEDGSPLKDEVDLAEELIWYCAPSFTEFIYRFWLENSIWFALVEKNQPLTAVQQAYLAHYRVTPSA